jgi:hypothetical protein
MKYKPNLDWNHAWGTAPLNIIVRYIWGITPALPGFKAVTIEPQLDELEFSTINLPTRTGIIHAEYKRKKNGSKFFTIRLPDHLKGEFVVPSLSTKVYFNKTKIKSDKGIIRLIEGTNIIELR